MGMQLIRTLIILLFLVLPFTVRGGTLSNIDGTAVTTPSTCSAGQAAQGVTTTGTATGCYATAPTEVSFKAYHTGADQSVTASTYTKVVLNAESYDNGGYFDSTTNSRFTPLVAGRYHFTGSVDWDNLAATNYVYRMIYLNGAVVCYQGNSYEAASIEAVICDLNVNGSTDYVELYVWHNNASSKTMKDGEAVQFLSGYLIH